MVSCGVPIFGANRIEKVYVILRVFNLGRNTDMRIFVDPYRLRGMHIDFEVGTYHCKIKDAA